MRLSCFRENNEVFIISQLVLDRVPFNGSGFGVLLKPEPDPNPMFATRNFRENFEILIFVFRT